MLVPHSESSRQRANISFFLALIPFFLTRAADFAAKEGPLLISNSRYWNSPRPCSGSVTWFNCVLFPSKCGSGNLNFFCSESQPNLLGFQPRLRLMGAEKYRTPDHREEMSKIQCKLCFCNSNIKEHKLFFLNRVAHWNLGRTLLDIWYVLITSFVTRQNHLPDFSRLKCLEYQSLCSKSFFLLF